eukprot:1811882-Amphidinium_carterae.1
MQFGLANFSASKLQQVPRCCTIGDDRQLCTHGAIRNLAVAYVEISAESAIRNFLVDYICRGDCRGCLPHHLALRLHLSAHLSIYSGRVYGSTRTSALCVSSWGAGGSVGFLQGDKLWQQNHPQLAKVCCV